MRLFNIEDYSPVPSEELYLIEEFAALLTLNYNKQKGDTQGRQRRKGMSELRYIYFYADYRSEFAKYPEEERNREALIAAGLPEDHDLSPELLAALHRFKQLQDTRPIRMLKAARKTVDKLTEYFDSVELTIEGPEGENIINPDVSAKDVMANLSSLGKVLKGLEELEEQIKKEQEQSKSFRGEAEPGRLR